MGLCVCDCGGVWKIDTLHCHSLYALALLFVDLHIDLHELLSLDIMSSRAVVQTVVLHQGKTANSSCPIAAWR